MKQIIAPLLVIVLSACAPSSSQEKQDSWAKQIFAPSSALDQKACAQGRQARSSKPNPDDSPGQVVFTPKQGELNLISRSSLVYFYCSITVVAEILDAETRTLIRVKDTAVKGANIKVEVSLEHDSNEIARLKNPDSEASEPKWETDATYFRFGRFDQAQLAAFDQTTSFTIIVNRGLGEERYAVNPTNLPGL
jgi:hypothetical protein